MIVSLDSPDGQIALERSGFMPLPAGRILATAMRRRDLTVAQVAQETGLSEGALTALLSGDGSLDRLTARKLQRVFPRTFNLLLNIERSYEFYRRHGVIRPTSPLRRALIERRSRAAAAAA